MVQETRPTSSFVDLLAEDKVDGSSSGSSSSSSSSSSFSHMRGCPNNDSNDEDEDGVDDAACSVKNTPHTTTVPAIGRDPKDPVPMNSLVGQGSGGGVATDHDPWDNGVDSSADGIGGSDGGKFPPLTRCISTPQLQDGRVRRNSEALNRCVRIQLF